MPRKLVTISVNHQKKKWKIVIIIETSGTTLRQDRGHQETCRDHRLVTLSNTPSFGQSLFAVVILMKSSVVTFISKTQKSTASPRTECDGAPESTRNWLEGTRQSASRLGREGHLVSALPTAARPPFVHRITGRFPGFKEAADRRTV